MTVKEKDDLRHKTIIFLHIHKTAGSTLSTILERQFPAHAVFPGSLGVHPNLQTMRILWGKRYYPHQILAEFKALSIAEKSRIKYLHHHLPFGIHTHLEQPWAYVTMLRNPVDRVISMYYYMRRSPQIVELYNQVENISLEEYVVRDIDDARLPYGNNAQTFRISGVSKDASEVDVLKIAKRNLREYFLAFGLSERFNESLLLLARRLGWDWRNVLYSRRQVGMNKPSRREISRSELALIEKYNELDLELYEYAQQHFEETIRRQADSWTAELRRFEDQLVRHRSRPDVVAYNLALNYGIRANIWFRSKIINRLKI